MLGAEEEFHEEELFGPAEGLLDLPELRDEVLEVVAGGPEVSEPRLDTATT